MRSRIALVLTLATVFAASLRVTGQAPGGAQGSPSAARDWTADAAMKISERFTLASVGDVIIIRPVSQQPIPVSRALSK
jgi:hypothetical protein